MSLNLLDGHPAGESLSQPSVQRQEDSWSDACMESAWIFLGGSDFGHLQKTVPVWPFRNRPALILPRAQVETLPSFVPGAPHSGGLSSAHKTGWLRRGHLWEGGMVLNLQSHQMEKAGKPLLVKLIPTPPHPQLGMIVT